MRAPPCACILAGGRGTRIAGLYPDVPKPMIPVAGRPFIEWIIQYLARQGVKRFVVSLGHLAEVAENYFRQRPADDLTIRTASEPHALGTGGALLYALQEASECDPVLVANGDSLALADLAGAWTLMDDPGVDAAVVAVRVADAGRFGTLEVDSAGALRGFREKKPGQGLINAGLYLFRRAVLTRFPQREPLSLEHEVFPHLIEQGTRIVVYPCEAPFLDIGTPDSLMAADQFVRTYINQETMP